MMSYGLPVISLFAKQLPVARVMSWFCRALLCSRPTKDSHVFVFKSRVSALIQYPLFPSHG